MSYYAVPIYVGISFVLSLSYSFGEFIKHKGKTDTFTSGVLFSWLLTSSIVASIIAGIVAELNTGTVSSSHIAIMLLLLLGTLSISSCMVCSAW